MNMDKNDDKKKSGNAGKPASPRPSDYLRTVKSYLKKGAQKEAFILLQQAALQYPDDPFILSYYGCLLAIVERRYRAGVDCCRQALVLLEQQSSFGEEMLYPIFYLNLGRAYVAAGKKKEAFAELQRGLKFDNSNGEILREIRTLGWRKSALVPFLDRSNPINKYIGLILHETMKASDKKK